MTAKNSNSRKGMTVEQAANVAIFCALLTVAAIAATLAIAVRTHQSVVVTIGATALVGVPMFWLTVRSHQKVASFRPDSPRNSESNGLPE